MINLKKKIEEVFARLTENPINFKELHNGGKKEVVVLFLAVLHLIKGQLIKVEQNGRFSDIIVAKV
ncbi:segregation/condensation protein A [Patescibacteria group bacterium]|nr:segregation/condensation protein A [Patescibacteria group bacterium]